jgi:hypothetical protein
VNASGITHLFHKTAALAHRLASIGASLRQLYWRAGGFFAIFAQEQDFSETAAFWPAQAQDDDSSTT